MLKNKVGAVAIRSFALLVVLGMAYHAIAQNVATPYPNMAPIEQYLMTDRAAEIALARSAAPESISRDAEVLVLGRHGFETAVKGKNGFVCIVERSWARGDVLHDVEARIRRRHRRTLAFAPHVLLFAGRPRNLGSESAGFSDHCCERHPRARDYVRDCCATVVRRNGRSSGDASRTSFERNAVEPARKAVLLAPPWGEEQ